MDDIIVTSNHPLFTASLIHQRNQEFDLKDLSKLHYFLGLQIEYTPFVLFVHQYKYTLDLLTKFHMIDSKPCNTPCSPNTHLWPNDSSLLPDPT